MENNEWKMEMMGHPNCQYLKEDSWCFQSQAPPPYYQKSLVAPYYQDKLTPSCSPPPPYTTTSSTSISSRLLTILTLAILLLISLTIALLWKHLELLASLSTNLPQASIPPDDAPRLPKLPI